MGSKKKNNPEYQKAWRLAHPPTEEQKIANRKRAREWRIANPERHKATRARWNAKPESKKKMAVYHQKTRSQMNGQYRRNVELKHTYGIDLDDYKVMLEAQNCRCLICGRTAEESRSKADKLAVDHNHETGEVRGLLCTTCNQGLGSLQDDITILKSAIAYLELKGSYASIGG